MKTFVLDTNVLLHDPESLFSFGDNKIIIPISVIQELDNQKRRNDQIGLNAREISRKLDGLRNVGSLSEGVELPNNGILKIELNHNVIEEKFPLDLKTVDNRILNIANNLKNEKINGEVILVTKDLNLRIMADTIKIKSEDFISDKVDYKNLYSGFANFTMEAELIDELFKNGILKNSSNFSFFPNQFLVITDGNKKSCLARHHNNYFHTLRYGDLEITGIKALNKEQRFALELLMDDDIKVVSLCGKAGSGKTVMSLAVAINKISEMKNSKYNKILILRSIDAVENKDLGFFPGDKEEKMRPWMQPIHDNLEFLLGRDYDRYLNLNMEFEVLSYIRGRSINKNFIIVDDAQNNSPKAVKTILSRVGKNSKIVFTGDPEQIDSPYLDASSNGIVHIAERLKEEKITGHITLMKGERSDIAELASKL